VRWPASKSSPDRPHTAAPSKAAGVIVAAIWRGAERGRYIDYEVPAEGHQTVLDIVTYVQRHLEPPLAYRFSCRVGACGSCTMTVNGLPRRTCRTPVDKVIENGRIEIGPLANLPVIKDLVTGTSRFTQAHKAAHGCFIPSATRHDEVARVRPENANRLAADKAGTCIGCAACFSACDSVRWNDHYLGPAALNRAWSLVNDVRDLDTVQRMAAVTGSGGCHSCHTHQSCSELCPVGTNPTAAIAGLKRLAVSTFIREKL
jgi:fumarate reductase iron-sulfur subunit